ncbi:MAG: cyclodeaminase/cyclohydrolase family protein [Fusobacteriaceae bacterium]
MKLVDLTIDEFLSEVDSPSPAPGGGSASALVSALGVSLVRMVGHLSFGKKKFEGLDEGIKVEFKRRFQELKKIEEELKKLVDKDTESFNIFMAAMKMPKETEEEKKIRSVAMEEATKKTIETPLKIAQLSSEVLHLLDYFVTYGNKNAISDVGVATTLLYSGLEGAVMNIRVNLPNLSDEMLKADLERKSFELKKRAKIIKSGLLEEVYNFL